MFSRVLQFGCLPAFPRIPNIQPRACLLTTSPFFPFFSFLSFFNRSSLFLFSLTSRSWSITGAIPQFPPATSSSSRASRWSSQLPHGRRSSRQSQITSPSASLLPMKPMVVILCATRGTPSPAASRASRILHRRSLTASTTFLGGCPRNWAGSPIREVNGTRSWVSSV